MFGSKEEILKKTYVFETLGRPEKKREFKVKTLKKWGFDLIGDRFENIAIDKDGKAANILKELPKNLKIEAKIEMIEGVAYLNIALEREGETKELLKIEAAQILLAFLKKHKLPHLAESIQSIGSAATLAKHRCEEGKAVELELFPNSFRRFLKEAKKIEKKMEFGRICLVYFGENKDKIPRYKMEWQVPTIALFDEEIAQKIDKVLAELK